MSTEYDRARERRNEQRKKRYAEDPEFRKRRLDSCDRYRAAHQAEINARRRHRWATDPDYRARVLAEHRKLHRKEVLMRHGISLEEYEWLLALQGGVCAICEKKPKRGLLCVDHCHRTGKIRGLLCAKCNCGLGFYDDDPNRMHAATAYLRAAQRDCKASRDVMPPPRNKRNPAKPLRWCSAPPARAAMPARRSGRRHDRQAAAHHTQACR